MNFSVLEKGPQGLTDTLSEKDYGIRLWKLCIWIVLFCLLAEILIIRFWKIQPVTTPTPAA